MITKDNLRKVLDILGFRDDSNSGVYIQKYSDDMVSIEVDFNEQKIKYFPMDNTFKEGEFPTIAKPSTGFVAHRDTTFNFGANENFVCLVCADYLLKKGYKANHIVFEPAFKIGHVNKPSYGDILVFDKEYKPLILIENKTYGKEFNTEWSNMQKDGGQLFSYISGMSGKLGVCENIALYACDVDSQINSKIHIVTLKDNENRLKDLDNPISFKDCNGKYFEVWDKTYGKSFETKGLFEDGIEPYTIGKNKYTIKDLKTLSHSEIGSIYHAFATTLRYHAITDFEHTFYILMDLFLCKITDEKHNPDDLQFYYKGITRDTPKEYCNRLLRLYQQGKDDLFNIKVINKDREDITRIFEDTNRTKNGLYDAIVELVDEIKFYNIKKFNFISVENKEEFEINFQILIKIASLIQDINLSNSETNHFFGDLFEGLLSKNVHQTEGQFFTPMPITNFIINSLPDFSKGSPKILDFACGAGHFLTEFVKQYPNAKLYGIEKSQTLSQVAKIATILNGCQDARIVFKDSLSDINVMDKRYQGFDDESFDCIIANPPYSVKGFLETLTKNDIDQYTLKNYVDEKAYPTNKSIECFFMEKAYKMLKNKGFFGIVLPSSMLSNDNLYEYTRALLFRNFNIMSVVSLNSRTFGSTGTNTIILFAQKIKKNADGLVGTMLKKQDITQYNTYGFVEEYCDKQQYDRNDYFALMQDKVLSDSLNLNPIIQEYRNSFKAPKIPATLQKKWFEESDGFDADWKASKLYNKKFKEFVNSEQYVIKEQEYFEQKFIEYAIEIEKEKLTVFVEIADNNVLLLQSPPDKIGSKSNKAGIVNFLGYDWSNRKGDEGIKYVTEMPVYQPSDDDDEDADAQEQINSIKYIKTPLYNPQDKDDNTKLAYRIREHICENARGISPLSVPSNISENLDLVNISKLTDLIDFSRSTFDKSIKTTAPRNIVQIKYKKGIPVVKLGEVCDIKIGGTPDRNNNSYFIGKNLWVSISEMNGQLIVDTKEKISDEGVKKSNVKLIKKGTTLLSFKLSIGKTAIAGVDLYTNEAIAGLIPLSDNITNEFIFALFNSRIIDLDNVDYKAFGKSLNSTYLKQDVQIPLPSLDVQNEIVRKCSALDNQLQESKRKVEVLKAEIEERADMLFDKYELKSIGSLCESPMYGANVSAKEGNKDSDYRYIRITDITDDGNLNDDWKTAEVIEEKYILKEGDFLFARTGATAGKTFCYKADYGKAIYAGYLIKFRPNAELLHFDYLRIVTKSTIYKKWAENTRGGTAQPNINAQQYSGYKIPVPSLSVQQEIVSKIETIEQQISKLKSEIENIPQKKKAILEDALIEK